MSYSNPTLKLFGPHILPSSLHKRFQPMSPSFEGLPLEIVLSICNYVGDTHRASLPAMALTSKQCHAAAVVILFQTIRLKVRNREKLRNDTQECTDILERTQSFGNVHRLMVEGSMLDQQYDVRNVESSRIETKRRRRRAESAIDLDDGKSADELNNDGFRADRRLANVVYDGDDTWNPLASMIEQLPALSDLIYLCSNQLAPCILQALHQYLPQCRLHIKSFGFRSLEVTNMDAHEFALATSPCLHSISVKYAWLQAENHEEAVLRLAAGLALNLKEAKIRPEKHRSDNQLRLLSWRCKKPWRGFSLNTQKLVSAPASLRSLHLGGPSISSLSVMGWSMHTDFSILHALVLETRIAADGLDFLARKCSFSSLKKLSLVLTTHNHPENQIEGLTMDDSNYVGCFLRSLPSLITLKIVDEVRRNDFETILRYHGASLRKLCLSPFGRLSQISITPQEIAQIRESCPQLEDLSLTIPRSRGDAAEVAVYRALGTLSGVQKLSLTLDAFEFSAALTDDSDDEYGFDEFDRQLSEHRSAHSHFCNGHIRLAFINRALDENLARAIFQSISSTRMSGALPLRKLKLSMTGHGVFTMGIFTIRDVFEQIGRSWLLMRNPRDDRPDELLVREPGRQEREGTHRRSLARDLEVIFRKIWPERRKEGSDWRDDWHSLPLAHV
jgi:hypothetical protein